jgi:hypothetical protein
MVRFFKSSTFNRLLLCGVLTTFSVAVINPLPTYAVTLNDIAFWTRMEKLIEKMFKYRDKQDSNKILDIMFEIKTEVEGYTGTRIDFDTEFSKAKANIKKQGVKVPEKDFAKVREALKNKEKKANQRMMCRAAYLEDASAMSFRDYEVLYRAAQRHDKDKDQEEEKQELPMRLTIGITMILAGGFLCIAGTTLRMPACVEAGKGLASAGVSFAIEGYVNRQDEDKEKEKDKKKDN